MKYGIPVLEGTLLKRYKRFLADVRLLDGRELTVHCPNSGSMKTCSDPGSDCRISDSGNPKRKLLHTLEQVRGSRGWIGVNPGRANAIAAEALEAGVVPGLGAWNSLRREVALGKGTRLDILLEGGRTPIWIEVKSVSMRVNGMDTFPDAVTSRGLKHLEVLRGRVAAGERALMLYIIQRSGSTIFRPAADIDPDYAEGLRKAAEAGVDVVALGCKILKSGITALNPVPVDLG